MSFADSAASKTNEYFNRLEVDGEDEYIDHWDTAELLFLAEAVRGSDRNWVCVARNTKPYGEQIRPSDWFTPKNCALQYTRLLSEIEEESKKKSLPRNERETLEVMLSKSLLEKRKNELAWLNQQTKASANVLKTYIEMVEGGDFDDNIDDILKKLEEEEKLQEEKYTEYITRRENLNASKKLNKSRIVKGKSPAKASETKKKLSLSDPPESNPHHAAVEEVINTIKKEISTEEFASPTKTTPIKSEMETAPITLNALLDSKVTIPSSVAPTSPLLTSLLRSIASSSPASHTLSAANSPLKEVKSEIQSASSEGSTPKKTVTEGVFLSPPSKIPSAGISPLLTSLLKSAALPSTTISMPVAAAKELPESLSEVHGIKMEIDSSANQKSPRSSVPPSPRPTPASSPLLNSLLKNSPSTPLQMSPVKEISPKAVSSPQPFFNPTSALATAAAQQLAAATSTIPIFQQFELAENRKSSLSSSPTTSACLSAPTLSKLLEMPPSTPGRLPPLPVLDPTPTPPAAQATPSPAQSPQKTTVPLTPAAEVVPKTPEEAPPLKVVPLKTPVDDDAGVAVSVSQLTPSLPFELDTTPLENIDILEAVCESINQAFEEKVTRREEEQLHGESEKLKEQDDVIKNISPPKSSLTEASPDPVPLSLDVADKLPLLPLTPKPKTSPTLVKSEHLPSATPTSTLDANATAKAEEVVEDEKGGPGKKFYKSRTGVKKEESIEKTPETTSLLQSPRKAVQTKVESKSPVDATETPAAIEEPETPTKQLDAKVIKGSETKSPPAKKPRLYEKTPTEKPQELSEDEAVVRRSGRRGKKGRGRNAKSNLSKLAEPKDQYEFTESTEENSVGYQATNTLCYMPRLKEDSRAEDSKSKPFSQDSEETPIISVAEKKPAISLRSKKGSTPTNQQTSARKLFQSDEERMSDSLTSDEASNHLLSEDKLKKWEETCEKKGDNLKGAAGESAKRTWKGIEIAKKKIPPPKRASASKAGKKERKPSSVDMEDLSTGSRDSEEVSGTDKDASEDINAATPMDLEAETNDSHACSSVAAESDKQMEDVEGGESFQGSVTTDFSPPPDVKEAPHFGKTDWMHNSPKSSEPVSQSSEESEYESDNWDNQSVSTNKSTSHSTHPRLKRKERETPEYKAWKKAISIVLREVSCHKNANVFLQKVTNDVAPGYLNIVHQPMDLSLIKKNIDNGVIKTTSEFHRDLLLMFQNAIMYNSSDHDVHQMAVEMQRDVIEQIEAFLETQGNSINTASEPVTNLRGARTAKTQKGKHHASSKSKDDAD